MDLLTGSERAFLASGCCCVQFEPDGSLLANTQAGLQRWPVRIDPNAPHRLRIGPPERIPVPVPAAISRFVVSADGKVLVGSNPYRDGAFVWPRDRPEEAIHLMPHPDCRFVAVSPDGKLVATGSFSGTGLKVWNARNGQLVREFLPGSGYTFPYFSPDGRWLINVAGQRWAVADWTEAPPYPSGSEMAFASPGLRLAACAGKGFTHLIDPETGRELARLEDPNQDRFQSITFSPDSTQLIGTTNDSSCVRVWDLRKIRAGLVELDLDWAAPAYPPEPTPVARTPLQVEVISEAPAPGGPIPE